MDSSVCAGLSSSGMECRPRSWLRCSRNSCPVRGSSTRTTWPSHCTLTLRPIQPGGRTVVSSIDFDAVHPSSRAGRQTDTGETAPTAVAAAPASCLRRTWLRPGAWWCHGFACQPSWFPSDQGRSAPLPSSQNVSPSMVCSWRARRRVRLSLRSGSATRQVTQRRRRTGEHVAIRADSRPDRRYPAKHPPSLRLSSTIVRQAPPRRRERAV